MNIEAAIGRQFKDRRRQDLAIRGDNDDFRLKLFDLLETGQIKPVIAARFPLGRAAEAHALMESSQHIGKIVLTTGG